MSYLRQETLDDITIDGIIYHYNEIKKRGEELRSFDKAEWVEAELAQLGRDLRSFEGVLEYFGFTDPVEVLTLFLTEKL